MDTFNEYQIEIYAGPSPEMDFTFHGPDFPQGEDIRSLIMSGIKYDCDMLTDLEDMDMYDLDVDQEQSHLRTMGNEANERVYLISTSRCMYCNQLDENENCNCETTLYMVTIIKKET